MRPEGYGTMEDIAKELEVGDYFSLTTFILVRGNLVGKNWCSAELKNLTSSIRNELIEMANEQVMEWQWYKQSNENFCRRCCLDSEAALRTTSKRCRKTSRGLSAASSTYLIWSTLATTSTVSGANDHNNDTEELPNRKEAISITTEQ
jgi:hypothetical protein